MVESGCVRAFQTVTDSMLAVDIVTRKSFYTSKVVSQIRGQADITAEVKIKEFNLLESEIVTNEKSLSKEAIGILFLMIVHLTEFLAKFVSKNRSRISEGSLQSAFKRMDQFGQATTAYRE
jgi:hypothetical protein